MWKSVFIENTTKCNLRCPGCKRNHVVPQDMDMKTFETALERFDGINETESFSFFWRGEPTFDSFLPEKAMMAKERGYITYTSTNTATPLLHDRDYVKRLLDSMDRICFCVDGYDQRTLGFYRKGAQWDVLIKNLRTIASIESDCKKEMRTLMFKYNENHEQKFVEMAERFGMDVLFFGLPIINGHRALSDMEAVRWLATKKRYRRYRKEGKQWIHRDRGACTLIPVISVDGTVAPCCYDWKIAYPLGNILHDDIDTITVNMGKISARAKRRQLSMCQKDCFIANVGVNVIKRLYQDAT